MLVLKKCQNSQSDFIREVTHSFGKMLGKLQLLKSQATDLKSQIWDKS